MFSEALFKMLSQVGIIFGQLHKSIYVHKPNLISCSNITYKR